MGLRTKKRFVDPVVNLWTGENRKRLRGCANQRNRCWLRLSIAALLIALVSCSAFFIHSYRAYARIVDARLAHGYLISRAGIYAAPHTLRPGQKFSKVSLAAVLRRAGYIESEAGDERMGQGGSTITQQLVKNTYLTPARTLRRKYAEAMLALTIERRLSKEEIFALYCNEIYLGQRGAFAVRGVDQAARVYFGKPLNDLSLAEAATIAGMIQGPSRYSPVHHADAARARRNTVLGTMARDGFITLDQAANAANEPLLIADFDPARESAAPYLIDYVNRVTAEA